MTDQEEPTPRRWFQFRLRTLLIFMTLCAFLFAWVNWELEQRRREMAAVSWVEKMGGRVEFPHYLAEGWWQQQTDSWFGVRMQGVYLDLTEVNDLSPLVGLENLRLYLNGDEVSDLSPLADLENLTSLRLYSLQASDLSSLAGLTGLSHLDLEYMPVSDLSPLTGLATLKFLSLSDMPVCDLSPLAGVANLQALHITNTPVSDLSPLAGLVILRNLYVASTQVSDLSPLTGLRNLKRLDVSNTRVSREQVQMLQQTLPNCKIEHSIREEDEDNADEGNEE